VLEPFVGGRWYSSCEDGSEATVGHVSVWEPGRRLVFSWEINAQWMSDPRRAYASEVEVVFSAAGDGQTRVDLEHRGFERMDVEGGEKMRGDVDRGWPGLLQLYAGAMAQGLVAKYVFAPPLIFAAAISIWPRLRKKH
jgi:uncharacterized protein YndB with AHSA1/START domain